MAMKTVLNASLVDCTSAAIKRVCQLKPMEAEHQLIRLNAGPNIVGRCKETGICDIRCSKHQLDLQVDVEACRIRLKVLGVNPCGVNGFMVMQNTECDLQHGDILEIVYGRHIFEVKFKPPANRIVLQEPSVEGWDAIDNGSMMVFTSAGVQASDKIAGYDIDGTIIRTKSGNVFPKNCDDWQLNYPQVRTKLKRLQDDGYKVCFFTNQGGIAKGKVKLDDFKKKIRLIQQQLDIPVQVFVAIDNGFYRKPAPGMWQHLLAKKNNGIEIKLEKSFFVGDAAGRPESGSGANKRKKDHSLVDRFFAANVGISFYTPEEHFLGTKTEHWNKPEFEPQSIDNITQPIFEPADTKIPAAEYEVIVLMGLPGSGKSHFARYYLEPLGYRIFNADTLGSTQACLKGCEQTLRAGQSCAVDNTNVDVDSRKKFIDLAKTLNVPCRCFVMNVPLAQVRHNIAYRQLVDTKHSKINDMIMNMMKKKYKEPTVEEGFSQVVRINPKMKFENAKQAELYKLYLVEK